MAHCEYIRMPDGSIAFARVSGPRAKPCHVCGASSVKLCDYRSGGKTCDRPLCDAHAVAITPAIDFCQEHPR